MAETPNQLPDAQLAARVLELERTAREQAARLYALERSLGAPAVNTSPPMPPVVAPRVTTPPPPVTPLPAAGKSKANFEERFGGQWLNRIGVVVLIFGIGFFLKYAFDNEWVGARGRVLAGVFLGFAALFGGARLRARGYRDYASGLFGGGIVTLYLSIYAAYDFYQLIGQVPAFALMACVTALAVLLAARYDALPIAALGLIGGFLTPALLASGESREVTLFSYITLLNVGVLALAYRRAWRSLNYMAFIATVASFVLWSLNYYYARDFTTTFFFATLFFSIFVTVTILHNIAQQRLSRWLDITLVFANATSYFAIGLFLLSDVYERWQSPFALALAGAYAALYLIARRRVPADRLLDATMFGLSVFFVTMALALQFEKQVLAIGWGLEGVVLAWVSWRAGNAAARLASLAVFALALLYWFGIILPDVSNQALNLSEPFVLLFNRRGFSGLILTVALGGAAWIYARQGREDAQATDLSFAVFGLFLAANAVLLTLLSVEVYDYLGRTATTVTNAEAFDRTLSGVASSRQQLALSVIWTIYAGVLLIAGVVWKSATMRVMALVLLGVTILKVFLFDLSSLEAINRIISFLVLGVVLLGVSFLYQRRQQGESP